MNKDRPDPGSFVFPGTKPSSKMAKRISSMFSLSSNHSDQATSSNDSREPSSLHPARPPREQSIPNLSTTSTPKLLPTADSPDLQNGQCLGAAPRLNTSLSPQIDDGQSMLQSPHTLSPLPMHSASPGGSRPASPATPSFLQPPELLQPLPTQIESQSGSRPRRASLNRISIGSRSSSRPPSRPASPVKSRPQTPLGNKLSKRRSWIPGIARGLSQSEGQAPPAYSMQAWIVTPQEKLPYDTFPLAIFDKVGF